MNAAELTGLRTIGEQYLPEDSRPHCRIVQTGIATAGAVEVDKSPLAAFHHCNHSLAQNYPYQSLEETREMFHAFYDWNLSLPVPASIQQVSLCRCLTFKVSILKLNILRKRLGLMGQEHD
jgi:hypothetical protein